MSEATKSLIVFNHATTGEVALCCHATTNDPFRIFPALLDLFRDSATGDVTQPSAVEWASQLCAATSQIHRYSGQIPQELAQDAGFSSIFVVRTGMKETEFSWFQRLMAPVGKPSGLGALLGIAEDQPLLAPLRKQAQFTLGDAESPVSRKDLALKMQLARLVRADTLITGAVFAIVGGVIGFGVPQMLRALGEDGPYMIGVRLFGGLFLALGLFFLGLGLLPLFTSNPWNRKVLIWWGNFLGGMAGAAAFGLPATAQLPCWFYLRFMRPDLAKKLPEEFTSWSFVQPLSFALGLVTLAGMYYIGRSVSRKRPGFVS
jgi:hypothetical protein